MLLVHRPAPAVEVVDETIPVHHDRALTFAKRLPTTGGTVRRSLLHHRVGVGGRRVAHVLSTLVQYGTGGSQRRGGFGVTSGSQIGTSDHQPSPAGTGRYSGSSRTDRGFATSATAPSPVGADHRRGSASAPPPGHTSSRRGSDSDGQRHRAMSAGPCRKPDRALVTDPQWMARTADVGKRRGVAQMPWRRVRAPPNRRHTAENTPIVRP